MGIAIIGHFGGKKVFNDGQTIKTITTYNVLQKVLPGKIHKVDTYYLRHNPLRFLCQMMAAVCRDKRMVVLLSQNGRRILFPFLYYCVKVFRKWVYQNTIAGMLADEAEKKPKFRKYIASFKANWVEAKVMEKKLHKLGVMNARYVPNFKNLKPVSDILPATTWKDVPKNFCLFSRVVKEKGVELAIDAITNINRQAKKTVVTLDIYGPVDDAYKERFEKVMRDSEDFISYCGFIPAEESVDTLKNYYMLLFPTLYVTEGMPGTIIDALFSALPVIASNWKFCGEMLTDGKTALVYDFDKPELLEQKIVFAISHPEIIQAMRAECLKEAEKYKEENIVPILLKDMDLN